MNRGWLAILLLATIAVSAGRGGQTAGQDNAPKQQPKKAESFLHKVLRVSGIAASPSTLKGPGDEVQSGRIWLVELESKKTRRLTSEGGYRSPVFFPGDGDVLAVRGTDVVRINRSGGAVKPVSSIRGINKLVGFSEDETDKVLVLAADAAGTTTVGWLSVSTEKIEAVGYDAGSSEDRQMLEQLRGWDRTYGSRKIFVQRQSKGSVAGPVEWTDVFLKEGASEPRNVSDCDEVNCGQPSLSGDGKWMVYVKAER